MIQLRRPNLNTKFQIDLAWWEQNSRDFRLYLRANLCPRCQREFEDVTDVQEYDSVDPGTAEVRRIDEVWGRLIAHCSRQPGYITADVPLSMAIFRALLAAGNEPKDADELYEIVKKSNPEQILRLLTSPHVVYGIVPATFG